VIKVTSPKHKQGREHRGAGGDSGPSLPVTSGPPTLLDRCKANEDKAWIEFFSQRSSQVYRWAILLGMPAEDAEDAAQEVLATAARRIDTCRNEIVMTSWLYQITRRVVANARRRVWWRFWKASDDSVDRRLLVKEDGSRPENEIEVRRCLARLPASQSEVLVLMEIEGFTRAETAEALGLPAGTVASRLRVAREAFKVEWANEKRSKMGGDEQS
jgi:RNA polymerase sigma factor (sigma-70 family)